MILTIGCYTSSDAPNGLHLVDFDCATGKMRLIESYAVDNPHYLVKSADGKFLYSNLTEGLGAFSIAADGRLTKTDELRLGGKSMCHLALMQEDTLLTWAAYSSGEAGLVKVRDGMFLGEIRRDRHVGRGPDPRQASAHCHEAVPTPTGDAYVVVDLGLDQLVTYPAAAEGEAKVFSTAPAGAGPRHILFHPNGKRAFVVFELGSRLASYSWSAADGFTMLDSVSTLPADWKGLNQDAAIRFTPDGKRVVVSNRGYDSLTVFDYDLESGKLTFKARSVLPGSWPRDFLFIPGTDFAVVTMERSGTLLTVRYDATTGVFTPIDSLHGIYRPIVVIN